MNQFSRNDFSPQRVEMSSIAAVSVAHTLRSAGFGLCKIEDRPSRIVLFQQPVEFGALGVDDGSEVLLAQHLLDRPLPTRSGRRQRRRHWNERHRRVLRLQPVQRCGISREQFCRVGGGVEIDKAELHQGDVRLLGQRGELADEILTLAVGVSVLADEGIGQIQLRAHFVQTFYYVCAHGLVAEINSQIANLVHFQGGDLLLRVLTSDQQKRRDHR